MDGWMNGWMDRWMERWMGTICLIDGVSNRIHSILYSTLYILGTWPWDGSHKIKYNKSICIQPLLR